MNKFNSKWALTAALATALVAGCGGGSNGGSAVSSDAAAATSPAVAALVTQYAALITAASENGDQITDVDTLALASDESSDPVKIN